MWGGKSWGEITCTFFFLFYLMNVNILFLKTQCLRLQYFAGVFWGECVDEIENHCLIWTDVQVPKREKPRATGLEFLTRVFWFLSSFGKTAHIRSYFMMFWLFSLLNDGISMSDQRHCEFQIFNSLSDLSAKHVCIYSDGWVGSVVAIGTWSTAVISVVTNGSCAPVVLFVLNKPGVC